MYIFIFTFILRFSVDFLWTSCLSGQSDSVCASTRNANGPPFHIPGTAPHVSLRWLKKVLFPSAQQVILACSFVQIVCQTLTTKPKHLRLESLVPSKEDLAVDPHSCCWAQPSAGRDCPASCGTRHPAQGADTHTSHG